MEPTKTPPKLTEEQKQRFMEAIQQENQKTFTGFEKPTLNFYMDMEFVQDFRLGALMQLITTDVEYEYIRSQILEYNINDTGLVTKSFPSLGITEEQIDAYSANKENWIDLALGSPFYTNLELLVTKIQDARAANLLKDCTQPITLYLGCKTFPYPIPAQHEFIKLLERFLDKVNVIFMPSTLYEFQDRAIDDYDVYLVQKASALINHPKLVKKFEQMEMTSKIIVGMVENNATDDDLRAFSTTKDEAYKATVEFANIFTHFTFAEHVIQV